MITGETSASAEVFYTIPKWKQARWQIRHCAERQLSAANSLDTTRFAEGTREQVLYGYERNSWGPGEELFVRDFNVTASRKFNKRFKAKYAYYHFDFNTSTTPVTTDYKGIVNANIHVGDANQGQAQAEPCAPQLQGLWVGEDKDDPTLLQDKDTGPQSWREYTWSPHWFVSVLDQYNFGNNDETKRVHYIYGAAGYIQGPHRLKRGMESAEKASSVWGVFVKAVCRPSNGFEVTFTSKTFDGSNPTSLIFVTCLPKPKPKPALMKKFFALMASAVISAGAFAQLPDGSVALDFTATDINGVEHNLYSYLDLWYPRSWTFLPLGAAHAGATTQAACSLS